MTAAFELERFTYSDGELEVAGRWRAGTPRRFRRVRLLVEEDGRVRRLAPATSEPVTATPEGEAWSASFRRPGGEAEITRAELEVGRDLVVALPTPVPVSSNGSALGPDPAGDARCDRDEALAARRALEQERAALEREREDIERAWAELKAARREVEDDRARLDEALAELEDERAAIEAAREQVAAATPQAAPAPPPARRAIPARQVTADPLTLRVAAAALSVPAVVAVLVILDSL